MNYGFLIRNDRCIGCHACSTACKSENEVPLGVNRTWVKSVEKGAFPDVRRHFQVTRCNHCANPPCVRICPVHAMYQRDDGIVEFDGDLCIGCKACLQACPYDAIYVDPATGTAAKCHFCAHRIDLGLEPACVVVCPEHAIVSGDLDDPTAEISRMLAGHETTVRKPEQGTAPKLFYVDGEDALLHPAATERTPPSFAWVEVASLASGQRAADRQVHRVPERPIPSGSGRHPLTGVSLRESQPQGLPVGGPIHVGDGRRAGELVRGVYNAQHRVPWHWPVPAYLLTKGMGTGVFLVLALGVLGGLFPLEGRLAAVGGLLSLIFLGGTTALLVLDLERPERFLRILTRPQWRSWLTRGGYLLVAFSLLVSAWCALEVGAWAGLWSSELTLRFRGGFFWLGVPLALAVAVYTAFLFGQAEGRDLWQSPLLPLHLVLQAALGGASVLLVLAVVMELDPDVARVASGTLTIGLLLDLLVAIPGELAMPHASADAARAAGEILRGRYRAHFWFGSVLLGHLAPLALLLLGGAPGAALAAVAALTGIYFYEHAYVLAPQEVPNS